MRFIFLNNKMISEYLYLISNDYLLLILLLKCFMHVQGSLLMMRYDIGLKCEEYNNYCVQ